MLFGSADNVPRTCSEIKARYPAWQEDYPSPHRALNSFDFRAKKPIIKMEHPPYSPNLALCDFWLFTKLKNALKRQRSTAIRDFQRDVATLLQAIPEHDFRTVFGSGAISHEMRSLTRRVIRRLMQSLLHSYGNFAFSKPFCKVNVRTCVFSIPASQKLLTIVS
jgi:hypothetical protein